MDPGLFMSVLAQGEQQTRQLKAQLDDPLDVESCKSLARQVQLSFENAIAMAKSLGTGGTGTGNGVVVVGGWDSPLQSGGSESPRSEGSDQGMKGEMMMCKKRKGLPKWSSQVRVNLGGGIEGPLDDGYSWRKYGQKDILGAKFPRGYYRCTHRNSQGCLATKQVQRSDGDPSVFDVSYRGTHSCIERPQKAQSSPKQRQYTPSDSNQLQQQQLLDRLRASLTVKTEGLEANGGQANTTNSSSFSFPSTPASCMQTQINMFLSSSVHDNNPFTSSTFPPNFISGTPSESSYFSCYGAGPNTHNSASELTDIVSAATSAANSPMVDIDFALGHAEFDTNFAFDSSSFF